MSKLLKEFREFAVQGNMIDMAVGMIIGAAFKDLVNSLVSDMVMPVIGLFTGKLDFSNMFISLNGEHYATLAEAQAAAAPTVNYGLFITEIINFIIMAVRDLHGSQTAEPRKENVRETGSSGSCYGEGMPVLQNKNQYPCDTLSALYIRAGRQIVFSGR